MTLQIDRLIQFLESDFSRGLALLRTSALMAEDLRGVATINRDRLTPGERKRIAGVVARVRLAAARANEAAGSRTEVIPGHGRGFADAALPRHARHSGELELE